MQVAIIAGGLGTRLGPLTSHQPKSMIRILGKPFIEYQFELLKKGGVEEIVLCLGYLGKQIEDHCADGRKFGIRLKYSYESELLDTAGALKQAGPFLEDIFFTLYGDSYGFLDFREMSNELKQQNKIAAMSVYKNKNRYDDSNTAIENGLVTQYSKEKKNKCLYIDYGVNLFHKEVLQLIPDSEPYSMGELFHQLIERRQMLAFEVKKRFYEIGSIDGLQEFTQYIRNKNIRNKI